MAKAPSRTALEPPGAGEPGARMTIREFRDTQASE
eukprot:CAMPEP_0204213448 /NCGR_PEP_ID=MMETSP0361-20130328/75996_1 /ASSEMBLY_ACC=CAM_ASM_000343 /TAXON_ID=268821 /ORGANISM="Scrippsiella Hangoei, Strain SHTV-5" /LENGTH=34 /DNA_ID= /DNA_START= /DNA_END= /DNA_ORIENTATION=